MAGSRIEPPSVEQMDAETYEAMSAAERKAWCHLLLAPLLQRVREVAAVHAVPPRLLAVVLLNDLARPRRGPTPIQLSTRSRADLLDFPGDLTRLRECAERRQAEFTADTGLPRAPVDSHHFETEARLELLRERLALPEQRIESTARTLRTLLDRRGVARENDPATGLAGSTPYERALNLAEQLTLAYHLPDRNAALHGFNARSIAAYLWQEDLLPDRP